MRIGLVLLSAALLAPPAGLAPAATTNTNSPKGHVVTGVIHPDNSLVVPFPDTDVGTDSFVPCYYACFGDMPSVCDLGGSISLTQLPALPFSALNFRIGVAGTDCSGTPTSLPVVLNAGQILLVDFDFAPTARGPFSSDLIYNATITGGSPDGLTYTLTGTGVDAANVVVSQLPSGILQAQNTAGGTDSYTLTNTGSVTTTVELGQHGNFFHQSPTSFSLQPGASQVVTITGLAEPGGNFTGSAIPTGGGVADGLSIPINMLSAVPPTGTVNPGPLVARSEVSGPPDENQNGGVSYDNEGNDTVQGILTSDSAWLIPQSGIITIGPGGSTGMSFSIDNSLRPDGANPLGSVSGQLKMSFLTNGANNSKTLSPDATPPPPSSSASVVVVSVSVPTVAPTPVTALPPGTSSFFIPGVTSNTNQLVDLFLSNIGTSVSASPLQLFFTGALGAPTTAVSAQIPVLAPSVPLAFGDVIGTVFPSSASTGTLQLRASTSDSLALQSVLLNLTNDIGSFGTSLPVFKNSDSIGGGGKIFLTDLESDASTTSDLFIQETSGSAATVRVDFLSSTGTTLLTQNPVSVPPFGMVSMVGTVPTNAVSAVVTNGVTNTGRVVAMAIRHDTGSGDPAAIASAASSSPLIVPLVMTDKVSANPTRTELAIMNTTSTATTATLSFSFPDRSHSIERSESTTGHLELKPAATKSVSVTLRANQTMVIPDVSVINNVATGITGTGALTITSSGGALSVASRIVTSPPANQGNTNPPRTGTWGSNVPVIPIAKALTRGTTRALTGLGDSKASTIQIETGSTYRTHFGFVETAGASAVVHVTAHFTFPAGNAAQAVGQVSRDFPIAAHGFVLEDDMLKALTSPLRDTELGDLSDVELDFQITSGNGSIIPFTFSTDNGTGDMIVRVP